MIEFTEARANAIFTVAQAQRFLTDALQALMNENDAIARFSLRRASAEIGSVWLYLSNRAYEKKRGQK